MAGCDKPLPNEEQISRILEKLKKEPVGVGPDGEPYMLLVFKLLMSVIPGQDGILHWFCQKTRPVVIEAATFLLRLHAFKSDSVNIWRGKLTGVLHGCCDCIEGYAEAKSCSKETYVRVFLNIRPG